MNKVELELETLAQESMRQKRVAQAMGNLIKSGKVKKFIETAVAMRGEFVTGDCSVYQDCLWVHVQVKELNGMNDERLQGILQTFEYMNPSFTHQPQDYASQLQREFKYNWEFPSDTAPTVQVFVVILAQVKEDSDTCHREVIGYTTPREPQPIYKIVCGEKDEQPSN